MQPVQNRTRRFFLKERDGKCTTVRPVRYGSYKIKTDSVAVFNDEFRADDAENLAEKAEVLHTGKSGVYLPETSAALDALTAAVLCLTE